MINRRYFISVIKPTGDGTGSYAYYSMTVARRSFLPQQVSVLDDAMEFIVDGLKDKPGAKLMIIAFSRC